MKRYLLFAYSYPDGGWEDFKTDGDTIEECIDWVVKYGQEFGEYDQAYIWVFTDLHIIDTVTGKVCFTEQQLDIKHRLFHITNPGEKIEFDEYMWNRSLTELRQFNRDHPRRR